jgi:hypothetical protein
MKPRTSVYRILARCKAAKHGPTEKATRKRENEKVTQELNEKHRSLTKEMEKTWELYEEDY